MQPLDLIPWRVKKLPDDSFAYLVPDAEIKLDGGKMMIRVVAATETMDRERDILRVKGADLRNHRKNPAVLFNHKRHWPLIARTEDPNGVYTVKTVGNQLEADNYFIQKGPNAKLANQVFQLVENGSLRGVSPGFMTRPGGTHKVKGPDGSPALMYDDWELIEITHCPIPMNGESLVLSIEKGFGSEAMLPELKEELMSYVPARAAVVTSGWQPASDALADLEGDEIDLSDADPPELTPSTQFYHAVHEKAFDLLGMVQELSAVQELDATKQASREILASAGRILTICKQKHADHLGEFPDQPGIPDGANGGVSSNKMAEWRVKAMEAWDEYKSRGVCAEQCQDITDAVAFLTALARDQRFGTSVRSVAKSFVRRLSNVRMVQVPSDSDDAEWAKVEEKLASVSDRFAALEKVEECSGGIYTHTRSLAQAT